MINGRYRVIRALGRGGGGWVYDVADALHPNRAVALKIAHGRAADQASLSLFKVEFSTMTKLDHPNVARVYDFEEIRGGHDFLITMERVDGEPISRSLGGTRDWRRVVDRIVPVCRALSYIHSRRIVHYDVKPQNILVDATGEVKVVDFGIAGGPSAHDGRVMGTLPYMPPELLFGEGTADHRADFYSLGVTLYELLFGSVPCPTTGALEIINWMSAGGVRVPASEQVPPWLARVIEKLCAKDPADRYRHANAVIEDINLHGSFAYPFETSETQKSYITSPRFCGRSAELERVMSFVSKRLGGRGGARSALWVRGVSGIGKSRLMKEVRQAAQLQRLVFIEGNCYENSPLEYGPLAEVLSQLVPVIEIMGGLDIVGDALPALVKIAPKLANGRSFAPLPKAADVEGERVQLLTMTAEFFVRAAERVPFVVYLNDMQWAGRGPAEMFSFLAQRAGDDEALGQHVCLALIGSYRSDEIEGRPLAAAAETLRSRGMAIGVELTPLDADQVGTVVRSMLGVDDIPAAFLSRVTDETLGNPFFVQEVMRELFENGSVYLEGGRWSARQSIDALQIPATMADVFRRRLALLGPEEKELVRVLAVHGRPLELARIADALGEHTTAERIADLLRDLERSMIVVPHRGRALAYNIAHDRMRETAYADLEDAERQAMHRRLAQALEAASAGLEEKDQPLDDFARHYREAAVPDKALGYALLAGAHALDRFWNDAAVEHLGHALSLMVETDSRFAATLEGYADGLTRVHRYDDAAANYGRLLALLRERFDCARVQGKLGEIYRQIGKLEDAERACWEALEALGYRRPRGRLGWLVAMIAGLFAVAFSRLGWHGRAAEAPHAATAALVFNQAAYVYSHLDQVRGFTTALLCWRFLRHSTDLATRSLAHTALGIYLAFVGFMRTGRAFLDRSVGDAERSGSVVAIGNAYAGRGMVVRYEEPIRVELADHERALAAFVRCGDLFAVANAETHIASCMFFRGALDAAARVATQARQRALRFAESPIAVSLLAIEGLYRTYQMRTDRAEIDALFARAEAMVVAHRNVLGLQQVLRLRGMSRCADGRLLEGIADLERAVAVRKESGDVTNYTFEALIRLCRAYLQLETLAADQARTLARMHAQVMRGTAKLHKNMRPCALLNDALIRERRGDRTGADRCFAEAVALAHERETLLFASEALYAWGMARQRTSDRARAEQCLRDARQIASDGGNRRLLLACDDALSARSSWLPLAQTPRDHSRGYSTQHSVDPA